LTWYDRHRRDLPWRENRDPYRVWVSEIMLQQTRVETVIPYYRRFLERFDTVEALAAAEVGEMLALWSGLGYYRRGRQMHAAAREIVARGEFPRTPEELATLPGIGEYTAAAVASIAFGVAVPVLDGNVERVLSRLLASAEDPKKRTVRRRLSAAAGKLLDPARPGDSNQALMELGATVCTPLRPTCLLCPLREGCRGAAQGRPEAYPPARRRRAQEKVRHLVALVEQGEGLLLFRRPEGSDLLAGTWELPWLELDPAGGLRGAKGEAPEEALAHRYGGAWIVGEHLATVRHSITHRAIQVEVHECGIRGTGVLAEGPEAGFYGAEKRQKLPLSSLVGKVLAATSARRGKRG